MYNCWDDELYIYQRLKCATVGMMSYIYTRGLDVQLLG